MTEPVVQAVELGFRYRGSAQPVLEGLSFAIDSGAFVAIVGPSGSGKSTLLYLLGLTLTPTTGSVIATGFQTPLTDSVASDVRAAHIGFLFQDSILDPVKTVADNILEGCLYGSSTGSDRARRCPQRTVNRLLETVGLADSGLSLRSPREISGGQAQRVALCRALIKEPAIVLADEPTGNLDAESGVVVIDTLRKAAADGAVVMIATHDPSIAAQADITIRVGK